MAEAADATEILGVRVTHPEKVLFPEDGITKGDLARYYAEIAPVLLRYVRERPLTLRPFPRGIDQTGFYLKDAPRGAPDWIETFRDVAESTGNPVDFVVATDERTLVWLAQYNSIEVHAWLSRVDRPDFPDWAVVDLDPSDDAEWADLARASLLVRDALNRAGLASFPKLSGQSGLHVLVPLERAHPFDHVRTYFQRLAERAAEAEPDLVTTNYDVASRGGRILVDYAQNARGKTTVAPYSVRPRRGAPVSVPLTWDEVAGAKERPRETLRTLPARLEKVGDVLAPALALHQRLPKLT